MNMWITMLISCVKSVYTAMIYTQFKHMLYLIVFVLCVYSYVYTFFIHAEYKSFPFVIILYKTLVKAKNSFLHTIHKTQYYCYLYIFNTIVISNKG